MNWLTPIGFLGLLGLVVLILIYIIKPNYQNKRISSTYIWRLSMKYNKKRVPISKIQNILVFICQMLILGALGTLLAGPVIENQRGKNGDEVIIVVDASVGMRMTDSGKTRFERALDGAKEKARTAFDKGAPVTLIIADDTPEFLYTRIDSDKEKEFTDTIDAIYFEAEEYCSFASADVNSAMTLVESVLELNSEAEVCFYTCADYVYKNGVNVINVATENEWNAAILDCRAELDNDNHYEITVNAACYGKTDFITVYCKIHGVNGDPENTVVLEKGEFFDPFEEEKELVFNSDDLSSEAIYSYEYVETYVSVRDSFSDDNSFYLYGGNKNVIKIQYASSSPNNFFESAVRSIRQSNMESWDVQLTMLKADEMYETEGYDLYIFEHRMPDVLPTDGVVLLVDPTTAPEGSGLQIGSSYKVDSSSVLSPGESHNLTKYTAPGRITIAKYNDIILNEGYEELMLYNGRPVMLLKDTAESKVVVWAFDLNYSNIIALPDFSVLMYNLFAYFMPETFGSSSYEVGETVSLSGRGTQLNVVGNGEEYTFENAKGEITPTRPGTYTVTQLGFGGKGLSEEKFFVNVPASESDTSKTVDVLPLSAPDSDVTIEYADLIIYFAIAIFVIMLAEWILEIKRNY